MVAGPLQSGGSPDPVADRKIVVLAEMDADRQRDHNHLAYTCIGGALLWKVLLVSTEPVTPYQLTGTITAEAKLTFSRSVL